MILTADDHRKEAEVAEYNEQCARRVDDYSAADRLKRVSEYHRKMQRELSE